MESNLTKSDKSLEQGLNYPPASASGSHLPRVSIATPGEAGVQPPGSLIVPTDGASAQGVSNGSAPEECENSTRHRDTATAQPPVAFGKAADGKPQLNVPEVSQGSEGEARHDCVSLQPPSHFSEDSSRDQMVASSSESEGVNKTFSGTQSHRAGVYSEGTESSTTIEVSHGSTDKPTKHLEVLDLVRDDGPLQQMYLHFGADVTPTGGQKTLAFSHLSADDLAEFNLSGAVAMGSVSDPTLRNKPRALNLYRLLQGMGISIPGVENDPKVAKCLVSGKYEWRVVPLKTIQGRNGSCGHGPFWPISDIGFLEPKARADTVRVVLFPKDQIQAAEFDENRRRNLTPKNIPRNLVSLTTMCRFKVRDFNHHVMLNERIKTDFMIRFDPRGEDIVRLRMTNLLMSDWSRLNFKPVVNGLLNAVIAKISPDHPGAPWVLGDKLEWLRAIKMSNLHENLFQSRMFRAFDFGNKDYVIVTRQCSVAQFRHRTINKTAFHVLFYGVCLGCQPL